MHVLLHVCVSWLVIMDMTLSMFLCIANMNTESWLSLDIISQQTALIMMYDWSMDETEMKE